MCLYHLIKYFAQSLVLVNIVLFLMCLVGHLFKERTPASKTEDMKKEEEQKDDPPDNTDAKSMDEVTNIKCLFTLNKVCISVPFLRGFIVTPFQYFCG